MQASFPRHATSNSKEVISGSTFFARKGQYFNGHNFVMEAIKNGATCVYYSEKLPFEELNFPLIKFVFVKNLEKSLPFILEEFYIIPSKLIGITGTNGKTSICFLAMQALGMLGVKSGFIGTTGVYYYDTKVEKISENELTTPDIISFYYNLAFLQSKGVQVVSFEASSIGLLMGRLGEIKVDVACFTNFTQDHLDFHLTMEAYFKAKTLLFTEVLKNNGLALLEDNICNKVETKAVKKCITIPQNFKTSATSTAFILEDVEFCMNLIGKFQIENAIFVIEIARYFGFSLPSIASIFPKLKAPNGRLQAVHKNPYVFVDYAHTPDSLLKVLTTLKAVQKAKIIVVFGCGGERDTLKRSIMGEIANKMADFSIITDDNPRMEDANEIRKQIIAGFSGTNYAEISDREKAIQEALKMANLEDVVLIAGKGHENYQIIGKKKYFFDDIKCVNDFFKNLANSSFPA
jgi:UDP-N-acetylmuramoyl-L-alanyl-D-glutamate--2,6-diaminopimelate ligase